MISRLSIKQKLVLIMMIPLLVVILLAAKLAYDSWNRSQNLKSLDRVVVLSVNISNLVHETQKERGMTAGFIGSKGNKFKEELPRQREEVNKKLKALNEFLAKFNKNNYSADFVKNLDSGINKLKDLEDIRKKVNALNIPAPKAIGYYTETNRLLLNILGNIVMLSNSTELSKSLGSYMNFLLAKERAGIERAVGTNTFAQNRFSEGLKANFYTLIAEQKAYLDVFLKMSTDNVIKTYEQTVKGKPIEEVERMRKIALFSNIDENFGVDPNYWFSTITEKINLLKNVEDYLSNSLLNSINSEKAEADFLLVLFSILSILGIAVTMVLARLIANTILVDVASVRAGVEDFFAFINFEKDDIKPIDIASKDELGAMSLLINQNIEKIKINIQKERELIGDTIRVAEKINKGHMDLKIEVESNNPALNELKNIINEMLQTLNTNITNILNVLTSYSKLDFRPKLNENSLEGIIQELAKDINILRDVIAKTLIENKNVGLLLSKKATILTDNMKGISQEANFQAASLEETSSNLEEITSNIKNNTQNTIKMANYGQKVQESVNLGQELANKTALSMEEINTQALAIGEAITVIDQIAFQTNILSLNAAVEAATAGESGKGFAVVAQEVRNLAARSAEAAKRIQELVESAQVKADEGKKIATEMIGGYTELNANITTTLELIQDVANSSKEQSEGIIQINDTVSNLDQITQKNAQHASEANEIAKQTLDISQEILEQVNAKEFDGKYDNTESNNQI